MFYIDISIYFYVCFRENNINKLIDCPVLFLELQYEIPHGIFSWQAQLVRNDPPDRSELWSSGPWAPKLGGQSPVEFRALVFVSFGGGL